MDKKLVPFSIDLNEYEDFNMKISANKKEYFNKTKKTINLNSSNVVDKLMVKYLAGEIQLDMSQKIDSPFSVQRGVSLGMDTWTKASKHLIDLESQKKSPKGKLGGIVVRLIKYYNHNGYIDSTLEGGEKDV